MSSKKSSSGNLYKGLRNKSFDIRHETLRQIIRSRQKYDVNSLIDALSDHPGFSKERKKPVVDCHTFTKRWLRDNYSESFYKTIDDDPYQELFVLPDLFMGDHESCLLEGARVFAENAFDDNGGEDTLTELKKIFDIDSIEFKWIRFYTKCYHTYSDYLFLAICLIIVDEEKTRALGVHTNGTIVELPYEEILSHDDFIVLQ